MDKNCNLITKFKFIAKNYNVLIVEDSQLFRTTLENKFLEKKFNCFSASTLAEAQQLLSDHEIHYIMLDIHLPDGNGYELIKKLENTSEKIFVMTDESDQNLRDSTYQKGVIDFINKGSNFFYKIDQIFAAIEHLEKNKFKRILVVDDSTVIQEQLKTLLSNRYYSIELASNADDALKIVQSKKIDLILLDVQLENSNGIDFLQKNNNEIIHIKKIPVLVITSNIQSSTIRDALKAGAVDVLKKPYLIEEIILKVDLWIDYRIKQEEIICSTKLLEEYKSVVDKSSIVSKANPSGIITYVNEKFCDLAGYSAEELIGKNHNIVRHPDMPKSAFQEMWHTIKELRQPWRGKVKNKKKDGSHYWVDAYISPIINADNEIEEFIGLRYDITELESYKDILKEKLTNTEQSLEENIQYTAQYEDAINQFTAVLKTDVNNYITYINDEFSKISGYSFDELHGVNCRDIRHFKHRKNKDCDKILEQLSHKEIVSIQFENISKENEPYYMDTVIYPIIDNHGEIKEYLHLMHDVTDIVNLHLEIEATQKDIVYKMGEIGESRSKETGNHVKRVALYSKLLAELYGLSTKEVDTLFTASPMHDIGKISIPDSILKKPAKLTDEEYEYMKGHTKIGYEILKDSSRDILKAASIVAYQHHERWDGKGYPQGLEGEDIHIYGRITAIADVFDALGSIRCYKPAWDDDKIYKLFEEEKGQQFDPELTTLFIDNKEKFLEIRAKWAD